MIGEISGGGRDCEHLGGKNEILHFRGMGGFRVMGGIADEYGQYCIHV